MKPFVRAIGLTLTTAVLATSFAFAAAPDMDNATPAKKPAHKSMAKGHTVKAKSHKATAHRAKSRRHHKVTAHRTRHHKGTKHMTKASTKKAAPKMAPKTNQ